MDGRRCRMCYDERETIGHMWNGRREMRERERKERGEIQNEDGREMDKMDKLLTSPLPSIFLSEFTK
jgi:hypothetical protein